MTVSKIQIIILKTETFTWGIYRGASEKSKAGNVLLQRMY
jgi:hypothetical protein